MNILQFQRLKARPHNGRPVHWFAIVTDLNRIYVQTVYAKASFLAHVLRDAGVQKVRDPIPAIDFKPDDYWHIDVVIPDDTDHTIFQLHTRVKHDAATFAALLSSVMVKHEFRVCKYDHTRFTFVHGSCLIDTPEFEFERCRTQYGMYRLPPDWL